MKIASQYLRAGLVAQSTITSLVGTRVYANVLPADVTLPAIRYYAQGGVTGVPSGGATGLLPEQETSFTVEAWAETVASAQSIMSAVRDYMCDADTKTISGSYVSTWAEGTPTTDIDQDTGWFSVRHSFRLVMET